MTKRYIRTILSMILAFAMTFTPIFSSGAAIATAFALDDDQEVTVHDAGDTSEDADTVLPEDGKDDTGDAASESTDQAAGDTDATDEQEALPESADETDEQADQDEATRTEYTYTDEQAGLKVTAVLEDAAAIPDDAELIATPITSDSTDYNFQAYMDALNKDEAVIYDESNTLLLDIAFIKDGVEIQPTAGKVSIDLAFLDSQLSGDLGAEDKSDISVIHLPLSGKVRDKYDTTADATDIEAADIEVEEITAEDNKLEVSVKDEEVSFELDSFSGIAITKPELFADTSVTGSATNDYNFKSILGPGLYYGITAETFDQQSHIQSNFAVNLYKGNGQGVDPDLSSASGAIVMSDAEYNGKGYINMGTNNSGTVLLYTNKSGNVLNDPRDFVTIITEDTATIKANYVDPIISYGASMSSELLSHANTPSVTITKDDSKMVIDTTAFPTDATIYIDGDSITNYLQDGKLRILKHPDQVIVFNFDSTSTLKLGRFWVGYPDMSEYTAVSEEVDGQRYIKSDTPVTKGGKNNAIDKIASHIAWNCNSVTSLDLSETTGMFLVPKTTATTKVTSTSSGWIVTGGKFTNTGGEWHSVYDELPDVDKANLNMKKTVDDKTPSMDQKFEFAIDKFDTSEKDNWKNLVTVQNDGGAINYSDNHLTEGWNVYRIQETKQANSTDGNYVIDTTVYYAAVKYENKGTETAKIMVASLPRYFKTFTESAFKVDGEKAEDIGLSNPVSELPATFKNYTASSQTELKVKKILDGKAEWGDSDEFTFILKRGTNTAESSIETPMPKDVTGDIATVTITKNDSPKTKTFGTIKYTAAGTYNYTIQEVVPDEAVNAKNIKYSEATDAEKADGGFVKDNITYDGSVHNVVVTVEKDKTDTTRLVITSVKCDGRTTDTQEITNTYDSEIGSGEIKVKKEIDGRDWKEGDTFTFTLTGRSGPVTPIPMPEGTDESGTKTIVIKYGDENYTKSFGKITFTKAGTYAYTIKEIKENIAGIIYDESEHVVTITVTPDSKGQLLTEYSGNVVIETVTNKYKATGSTELKASKSINDWGNAESFKFTLAPESRYYTLPDGTQIDYPMPEDVDENVYTKQVTVNKGGSLEAAFGSIVYNHAGTYTYSIYELLPAGVDKDNPTKDGVTYDTTIHTVEVTVVDNLDGTLTATAKYDGEEDPLTITNSYAATGEGELKATKSFDSWGEADSFTFVLTAGTNDAGVTTPMPAEAGNKTTLEKTVTKSDPIAEFGKINYEKVGVYNYTIHEVVPSGAQGGKKDGITYDTEVHNVVVTVTDNHNGTLTAIVKYDDKDDLTITNTYAASGTTELKAKKSINDWGKAESFTFRLTADSNTAGADVETPMPEEAGTSKTLDKTVTKTNLEAVFGTITYAKTGEYTYTINEVLPAGVTSDEPTKDGITYDTATHTVKVTVTDPNHNGKLSVNVSYDGKTGDAATITNTYAASGKTELKAKKSINDWGKAESFTFTLESVDNAPMPSDAVSGKKSVEITKTTADLEAKFGEIEYTAAGTYNYTIKEEVPEGAQDNKKDGITYDPTVHNVVVTVEDKHDGTLKVTVKYDGKEDLTITNTYAAAGELELSALKELTGRTLKAGEFSFELKDADGKVLQTKTNAADGTVTFDAISYTLADVAKSPIKYTISEVIPSDAEVKDGKYVKDGVTYDNTPQEIEVTLVDNKDGTITATPNKNGASVKFTNKYDAAGSIELEGTKTIENRDFKEGDSWTFTVSSEDKDAPLPAVNPVTISPTSGSTTKIAYGKINYKLGDLKGATTKTFKYTITESGTVKGVTNDTGTHTLVVTVKDNGDGTLSVSKEEADDGLSFTNTYDANGKIGLTGTKTLDNRDFQDGDSWTFTVSSEDKDAPLPSNNPVTITPDSGRAATIDFGTIAYELKDAGKTYSYTITESGTVKGVTNDPKITRTVKVSIEDVGSGELVVSLAEGSDSIAFTNKYDAEGEITLGGSKAITGRHFKEGDTATFRIEAVDNAPLPETTEVTIKPAKGSEAAFSFEKIEYKLSDLGGETSKTFEYKVTESSASMAGATKDDTVINVKVTVTDNGDGTLTATADKEASDIVFTNKYAAQGEVVLSALKELTDRTLKAGEFSFELKDADGKVLQTKTNASDGTVKFDAIPYTLADVAKSPIKYTISEVIPDDAELRDGKYVKDGVTYDNTPQEIKVTLVDNKDGTITATPDKNGAKVKFENSYEAKGEIVLGGSKTIIGRNFKDGDAATFRIEAVDNAPLPKSTEVTIKPTSGSDATFSFEKIEYKLSDLGGETSKTFEYKVTESSASMAGATKDDTVINVKVTVTDNGDGTLTATADKEASDIVFANKYAAQGEVVLSALKELTGRKLKAGEFIFELRDANGKVLQTKTNAADGTVTFDAISYTLADVENSPFTYTISEVTPVGTVEMEGQYVKDGVTYDVHEETITVTLVDNKDGTITATPDKTGTSVRFSNTYDAEGSIDLTGTKTIENRKFKEGDEWTFEIEAITEGAPAPDPGKVTITPTGGSKETIEYGTVEFTLSDLDGKAEKTFKYKVTESGTVDGVTNDSRTHTLTITVKDNGDGTLSVTKTEKGGGLSFINTYKPKKTVKTGDDTNLLTPVATFASSLLMLVLSFFSFRRNRRKEDEE